jgi:hypothetical protein
MTAVLRVDATPAWRAALEIDGRTTTFALRGDGAPPDVADGLVGAMLPVVMRRGGTLRIEGTLTRGALRNLTEYAEAWANWAPGRFHRVRLEPDAIADGRRTRGDHAAAVAWSGGLRAAHTLVRHRDGLVPAAFTLRAAVHVDGLGAGVPIPELGIPVRRVRMDGDVVDPDIGVLPVVAAALHLAGGDCAVGLHARRWSFATQQRYPRPEPVLPDLLSGDAFDVRADGGTASPGRMFADVGPLASHVAWQPAIADFEAMLADAPSRAVRARVALDQLRTDVRDTARWLGSATGLRPPWPR